MQKKFSHRNKCKVRGMDGGHFNYWFFGLYPSSVIPKTREHSDSESGSVSALR
jgi:hypothetical protein